jgi:glycosyltransferase involved in cell wall biosynthesis
MYDYVIVTHLPAFYKVNLYNELSKKLDIYVIFIANNTNEKRADDFVNLENVKFQYKILHNDNFQNRNKLQSLRKLNNILNRIKYTKILISGWDLVEFWFIALTNNKSKNCLALESTVLESNTKWIKRVIKKIFLSKISTVFASGKLHTKLLDKLNYKDEIRITKGVGIINKPNFAKTKRVYNYNFLFIGRLTYIKNLKFLIDIFNNLPNHKLTIIGDGEDKQQLQSIANSNIFFIEPIENNKLKYFFQKNDIFILPSISEPWGLVVEEALYFGLPVIVSSNCGCSELIENGKSGYIVNPYDSENLKKVILDIDEKKYNELLISVNEFSIENKDKYQVQIYNL